MIINPFVLYSTVANAQFLLAVIVISVFVKTYFLTLLSLQRFIPLTTRKPWIFLLGTLAGSMFGDIAWIVKLIREILIPHSSYIFVTFFIRIAWAFLIVQYQSLSFFIQSLTEKNFTFTQLHKLLLLISSSFVGYFLYIALFNSILTDETARELARQYTIEPPLEITAMRYVVLYLLNLLVLPGIYFSFKKIKSEKLPKILKKQFKIFAIYLLTPYLIVEFMLASYFIFYEMHVYLYPIVSISTLLLTYAIYYCMKKVMAFRFLNITKYVQSPLSVAIISDFKNTLEQLSAVTNMTELSHIAKNFFKETFNILPKYNILFIRNLNPLMQKSTQEYHKVELFVENFLRNHAFSICEFIRKTQILVYDEIVFNHFYEETLISSTIIKFLDTIHADIFIPIYNHNKIIAYLIIDKNARINDCYSKTERDEMLVFINYLANIINILQAKNTEILIQQEKELGEKIYFKDQETNQYKESIRSFFHSNNQPRQTGIIFYKNNHFTFINQTAKELINVNINYQDGHPLTKIFKNTAQKVNTFKTPQNCLIKNTNDTMLVITAMPHLDQNSVIFTVSHPDITDFITEKINFLVNSADWNYLLYLETTTIGQYINKIIPGSGTMLLNFKIDLLKIALSKNPVLLDLPKEDLMATVELLHHMSKRKLLHILDLRKPTNNQTISNKLFGATQLINQNSQEYSLFSKLNGIGTLYIHNIHFLDDETQEHLQEFIRQGFYRVYNSDQKIPSDIRIICSTNQNIQQLAQKNKQSLFSQLKKNKLSMPPLSSLPEKEFLDLAEGFTDQAIQTNTFRNLLSLTEKEKNKLLNNRPQSLQEFKIKIQQLLIKKSKKSKIHQETKFNPTFTVTDPSLIAAAQLGKQALKDRKIMTLLWDKFKNQNKVAIFLGVNRSSVNRRCKEYNLQ
jgi:transcriptional regulator with GAF, ATPase, and Fis domain